MRSTSVALPCTYFAVVVFLLASVSLAAVAYGAERASVVEGSDREPESSPASSTGLKKGKKGGGGSSPREPTPAIDPYTLESPLYKSKEEYKKKKAAEAANGMSPKHAAYQRRAGKKYLDTIEKEEKGVRKLPTGVLVKALKKGGLSVKKGGKEGEDTEGSELLSPTEVDDCVVHYTGWFRDGKKFDSSYDRGEPSTFKPQYVIPAWSQVLSIMREGDKWKIWVPYEMGYGLKGMGTVIPPYATLVFEVELIKVRGKGRPASDSDKAIKTLLNVTYEEM